jgi:hypothetical protein
MTTTLHPHAPAAHFAIETARKRVTLFNVDTCECCGGEVLAPNAVGGDARDLQKYLDLGMTTRDIPTAEIDVDEVGITFCTDCGGVSPPNEDEPVDLLK